MFEDQELLLNLVKLLFSGGIASVVYFLLKAPIGMTVTAFLTRVFAFLGLSEAEVKRYTAIVLTLGLGTGLYAFVASPVLGYFPMPESFEQWANMILALFALSFTTSQVIHARAELSQKSAAKCVCVEECQ